MNTLDLERGARDRQRQQVLEHAAEDVTGEQAERGPADRPRQRDLRAQQQGPDGELTDRHAERHADPDLAAL